MTKTLYLSDVDGTLLASSGTLSAVTRTTINRLIAEEGLRFSYATARSFESARVVLAGLDVRLPVAVYGGAFLVDPQNGDVLRWHQLAPDVVTLVVEECLARQLPPIVYDFCDARDRVTWNSAAESAGTRNYASTRRGDRRMRPVGSWADLPTDRVFYLTIIGGRKEITEFADAVAPRLTGRASMVMQRDSYYPDEYWLEISATEANKGAVAIELQRHAGADRLICFGDNNNDLPMFAVADVSFAMSNANETVRGSASAVIGSNDDDGVALELDRLHSAVPTGPVGQPPTAHGRPVRTSSTSQQ